MKKELLNADVIAAYCLTNVASISILKIDDYEERVFYRIDTNDKKGKIRYAKIYDNRYFRVNGSNIKLSECIRDIA